MKRYPAYKDSGVEWLGEVPEGWEVSSIGRLTSKIGSGKTPSGGAEVYSEEGILFIRSQNVYDEGLTLDEVVYISTEIDAEMKGSRVQPGDILLNITGASLGRTCQVPEAFQDANVNQHVCIIRPQHVEFGRFLSQALKSQNTKGQIGACLTGAARDGLNFQQVAAISVALPPFPEQRAITDFLYRETAKIDALVEEQRRLIALLAEKRQAVISHAVTKGLNPTAPLKPSGIDWLGDIPEEWEVMPLKYLGKAITGLTYSPEDVTEVGTLVLRSSNVQGGRITYDDNVFVSLDIPEVLRARSKDILICSRNGSRALIGKNALIEGNAIGETWGAFMTMFRSEFNDFLFYVFNSPIFDYQSASFLTSTINQLTIGNLNSLQVPVPPPDEQQEIASFLKGKTLEFDELIKTATSGIAFLQERRVALISAAVTGKIDVRDVVARVAAPRQSLSVSAMVAGIVIAKHGRQQDHGRVWLQKILFLAQTHANIDGIGGHYLRAANGPLDIGLRDQVEADLSAANAVHVTREPGEQGAYRYDFIGDASQLRADLAAKIGDRMDRFLRLMDRLGDMGTRQIEAVATLYAAWNDFLIDGKAPTDADLIHEVLENWHPAKKERLSKQYLADQLGWMRRQDIVPSGTGRKTYRDRLL